MSASVTSISSTPSSAGSTAGATLGMGSDEFMLLLLARLRNQNPLEPMEDKDFLGQVAQLNTLQELQKVNNTLKSFSISSQLADAADLIGKVVGYRGDDGLLHEGQVSSASLSAEQVLVWMTGQSIPLSQVLHVRAADA